MSSTLVSNGHKGVWIHNAVGEVWLTALRMGILDLSNPAPVPELSSLGREIGEALSAGWVEGILQYDFASLLSTSKASAPFHLIQARVEAELKERAALDPIIHYGQYSASSQFAVPEVEMLSRLLFDAAGVPTPPHIYTLDKGWIPA